VTSRHHGDHHGNRKKAAIDGAVRVQIKLKIGGAALAEEPIFRLS